MKGITFAFIIIMASIVATAVAKKVSQSTLLRVKVSPNKEDSASLAVLEEFTAAFLLKHPHAVILDRDLNDPQIPHLTKDEAAAGRTLVPNQTPEQKLHFALANELTDELVGAQHIVIATPLHNWGPPSSLKAWIDRIVNCRTFYTTTEHITTTPISIIVSSGGPYSIIDKLKPFDHLRPWISYVFQQIGSKEENIVFVNCDPTGRGLEAAMTRARSMIEKAVDRPLRQLPQQDL